MKQWSNEVKSTLNYLIKYAITPLSLFTLRTAQAKMTVFIEDSNTRTTFDGRMPMQVLDVVLSIMVPIFCEGMTCNRAPDSRLRSPSTFKWNRKYGITQANHASGAPNLSSACDLTLPVPFNSWLVKHTRAFPSKFARNACKGVP